MNSKSEYQKQLKVVTLLLAITLVCNPIIFYLKGYNLWVSMVIWLIACLIGLWINERFKLIRTFYFALISVFGLLYYSELVFISRFNEYIVEDLYLIEENYYRNKPLLNKTLSDKEYVTLYKTNSQGFRIGREDDPFRELGDVEWLFMGDSYTQGAQVEFEDLYTTLLSKNYGDRSILNAGISGFGLPDSYYYLEELLVSLNPELVFLQVCNFNDFMNVQERKRDVADVLMNEFEILKSALYPLKYANPAELPLGRWTEPFYPDLESNLDYNIFFKEDSDQKAGDIEAFRYWISRINELTKTNGSKLILIQLPTKEQIYFSDLNEVVQAFNIKISEIDMLRPNNILKEISDNLKIPLIDTKLRFENSPERVYFNYDEHLNENGHKVLSETINDFVQKSIRPKKVSSLSMYNTSDRYPNHFRDTIIYQSIRDSNFELFYSTDTLKESQRITYDDIDQLHPDIYNGWITYTQGDQENGRTDIILSHLNKTEIIKLNEEGYYGAIPSFDTSGENIVYAEWTIIDNKFTNPKVVIYNIESGDKHELVDDRYENWRPILHGDSLFYIRKSNGNFDIYLKNLANNSIDQITNTPYDEWDIDYNPHSKELLYTQNKSGNWNIESLNLTTSEKNQFTDSKGNEWDPFFFNNGIIYSAEYGLTSGIYFIPRKE